MFQALFIVFVFFLPSTAFALDYSPLAELPFVGTGVQTISGYLLSIFRLLIGLAGVMAVVRMVLCGFQAMMSLNPAARGEASQCVVGAITGLLLAFSSWLILGQINPTLLETDFSPPSVSSVSSGGQQPGVPNTQCDTANLCQGASSGGTPCFSAPGNTLCSDVYSSYADRYAGGGISASVLREVMAQESGCDVSRTSGEAHGLMQLKLDTANMYRGACGVTEAITVGWLRSASNAEASVCLAAAYLRSLYGGVCSGNIRQTLAGYNGGGPGACATMSQDCQTMTNCDGGTMRSWECPYEDPAHTQCNTGANSFQQTRNYVREILYCLP